MKSPHTHINCMEGVEVAANFIVVIILQHINRLNQHIIYLKHSKVTFDFYINKKAGAEINQ